MTVQLTIHLTFLLRRKSSTSSSTLFVAMIAVICTASIPVCTRATRALGGKKDPGAIVLDEIASLPITFFLVEMTSASVVVAGFALHRLFDITKPPPARQFERLPDGLGVMADDWAAGQEEPRTRYDGFLFVAKNSIDEPVRMPLR